MHANLVLCQVSDRVANVILASDDFILKKWMPKKSSVHIVEITKYVYHVRNLHMGNPHIRSEIDTTGNYGIYLLK